MDYQLELSENDMCMSKDGFRVHGLMLIDEVIYTSSKSSVMMRVFLHRLMNLALVLSLWMSGHF